jgi:threonine synthase
MKFESTRRGSAPVPLSSAIRSGAAPDGGLYMPAELPLAPELQPGWRLAAFAARMLAPFFKGDSLEDELEAICNEAFDFPLPLAKPDPAQDGFFALELFHGPTGAFKDFGARFLMACFDRIGDPAHPLTVLAATSGDTGGAVGCAAEGRSAAGAVILYPRGRVSPFQELQLTCWGNPVRALEVEGDFDDCQRLVKAAFADPRLAGAHRLSSANSINIGRLLPQMAYAGWAAVELFAATGVKPGFIIPTGNLGHGFATLYARAMGLPIGPVLLATNSNRTLWDWHKSGRYEPRPSLATVANAMDVGAPSNFERLVAVPAPLRELAVELVDDSAIRARIRSDFAASGYVWCPHSATAAEAFRRLPNSVRQERSWIAAATAHPYKFRETVEPLTRKAIEAPPALKAILGRQQLKTAIPAELGALAGVLEREPA